MASFADVAMECEVVEEWAFEAADEDWDHDAAEDADEAADEDWDYDAAEDVDDAVDGEEWWGAMYGLGGAGGGRVPLLWQACVVRTVSFL
jgi:hypothetical protein